MNQTADYIKRTKINALLILLNERERKYTWSSTA